MKEPHCQVILLLFPVFFAWGYSKYTRRAAENQGPTAMEAPGIV
jgi:hypothetical protein